MRGRGGTTLIEVLAGLLILGTSLVGLLVAKARHTRQWATAQRQLEAVEAADALLALWWQEPDSWPRNDSGDVPGHPDLAWRTGVAANDAAGQLKSQVVRLEIVNRQATGPEAVLAAVELAMPEPPKAVDSQAPDPGGRRP